MLEKLVYMLGLSDQRVFEEFFTLAKKLGRGYRKLENQYLWIKGNIPLCFVAHVDTLCPIKTAAGKYFKESNGIVTAWQETSKGKEKRIILGADDRAGCTILYDLLCNSNSFPKDRPHILITNYEECGALGTKAFLKEIPDLSMINLFIELDRKGANEYVEYNNNPQTVHDFMKGFGIKDGGSGTFTDIKLITEYSSIPSINLAIGYYREHTPDELLDLDVMMLTYKKIKRIIRQFPKESFGVVVPEPEPKEYEKFFKAYKNSNFFINEFEYINTIICDICGEDEGNCMCLPSKQRLIFDYKRVSKSTLGGT